ncbi:MAG: EcoRI family type II restriction endonuclease [Usitatibacteraceae bacterium]
MARKSDLRTQRAGTIINATSSRQEKALTKAIHRVAEQLTTKFSGISLAHEDEWKLKSVVERLRTSYPDVEFGYYFDSSAMRPDGGILSIVSLEGAHYPILISEKKNQGTNDLRAEEGKKKQAKGNAIERLGKNVIGFRTALKSEAIFPFVCFGDGCDFADDSSILDRVVTIAQFGALNTEHLHKQSDGAFDRGSFYFRVAEWSEDEMFERCLTIAQKSVHYYFSKHGEAAFVAQT